ncbi:hypothetical protein BS50DRAFT_568141 [Corynespora cassiicola Philippines]|uniref:Uncharacterized protein n=1 Tax=Corynespora cassiicola Philippines TaxID=1448308 RepID=A0A2T2PDV7_CORCC|nr:hypothetical protein BS50DRAFT_568141 [Corynespora cassiicola Philippines]
MAWHDSHGAPASPSDHIHRLYIYDHPPTAHEWTELCADDTRPPSASTPANVKQW